MVATAALGRTKYFSFSEEWKRGEGASIYDVRTPGEGVVKKQTHVLISCASRIVTRGGGPKLENFADVICTYTLPLVFYTEVLVTVTPLVIGLNCLMCL